MKNQLSLFLFSFVLLSSCRSITYKKESALHQPVSFTYINAVFSNVADSSVTYDSSMIFLLDYHIFKTQNILENWQEIKVHVESDDKKIQFTGRLGDSVVYQRELKGEEQDNYFRYRNVKWKGVPLIYFKYQEKILLFCTTPEGNLSLLHNLNFLGAIFIIGADYKRTEFLIYKKYQI